jgi:copper chaperone CopZ
VDRKGAVNNNETKKTETESLRLVVVKLDYAYRIETRLTRAVTPEQGKKGYEYMKEIKLQVKGMSCSGCEQRIQKVLARVEGVVRSAANHQAEEVRVVFDQNRTSEETLRSSIEQAGYEVLP